MDKNPLFSGLKFTKDLGKNSDLENDFEDDVKKSSKKAKSTTEQFEDTVDLGSDDDYIYVDHSHDEEHVLDDEEDVAFDIFNETQNDDADEVIVDRSNDEKPKNDNKSKPKHNEPAQKDIKFGRESSINSDIDEPEIIPDKKGSGLNKQEHDLNDEVILDSNEPDEPGLNVDVDLGSLDDNKKESPDDSDRVDLGSAFEPHDSEEVVDLGSDDDYVYVDHSGDESAFEPHDSEEVVDLGSDDDYGHVDYDAEPSVESREEEPIPDSAMSVEETKNNKSRVKRKFDSFISDVLNK